MRITFAAALIALAATPALAATCASPGGHFPLSEADFGRLERIEASRAKGLTAVTAMKTAEDKDYVVDLVGGAMGTPDPKDLPGDYQCRTIKLGGQYGPLTVYGWFKCRISSDFVLTKLTGSQNFTGVLNPVDDGMLFVGASNYDYEASRAYGEVAEHDLVGCLRQMPREPGHLILELPEPLLESDHDVIELRR